MNFKVELTINKSNTVTCNVQEELFKPKFKWIITSSNTSDIFANNHFEEYENYKIIDAIYTDSHSSQINISGDFELDKKVLICIVEHPLLGKSYSRPAMIEIKRS